MKCLWNECTHIKGVYESDISLNGERKRPEGSKTKLDCKGMCIVILNV